MALIKCKECGHEVSSKASACPNCGCPIPSGDNPSENETSVKPQPPTKGKAKTYVLFAIILCLLMGGGYYAYNNFFKDEDIVELTPEFIEAIRKYDYAYSFSEGFAAVKKDEKYGFINTKGEEIVPCRYDYAESFLDGKAKVRKGEKVGFINTKGEEVVPCRYDYADYFSEGFATIKKDEKYGFINTKGEEVVPCRYDYAESFSEGFATIKKDEKYGFINTKGEEVIPCKYDEADSFSEGFAMIVKDEKYGFINTKGEEVVPCKYNYVYVSEFSSYSYCSFSEGFAAVNKDWKWGFVNTKGEEVIPCKYDDAFSFSEGFAAVEKDGKWGYINTKGEEVIPCRYGYAYPFSEGFAAVEKDGKWGYINTKGEEVVPCKYDREHESDPCSFSNGFAFVVKENKYIEFSYKYGFVNTKGEEVVPCKYDRVESFSRNGVALAVLDCGERAIYGFIDKLGNTTFSQEDFDRKLAYEKQQEEEARREEERIRQEEEAKRLDWIQGTWTEYSYGSTSKVIINGNNIIVSMDGSTVYNGSYTIEGEHLVYNQHNGMSDYIILDRNSQRLKADESTYFSKVSSNGGYSSSNSDDYNVYSTDEGRTAYMEVLQLQKEARALIDRSAPYRRIMQSEVYGSYNYQVASIQNRQILNAAIEKQERALSIARNKLHDESLIRELKGQLDVLNKAKYSD